MDADGDLDVLAVASGAIAWYENLNPLDGDFNDDGVYDCLDINAPDDRGGHGWVRRPV